MTGYRLDALPLTGGLADAVPVVLVTLAVLPAVLGVVRVGRNQTRRFQAETRHAEQVVARLRLEPDDQETRLSARYRARVAEAARTEDELAISRIALQEAEIYLQHHRIALKNHSAYQQASLWSGLLGFAVVLGGAALTYFAGLDVGVVTALAGVFPAAAGGLLFRQANIVGSRAAENLRALEESVRRFGQLRGALAAAAEIDDPQARDRLYEIIGRHLLFPAHEPEALLNGSADGATHDASGGSAARS